MKIITKQYVRLSEAEEKALIEAAKALDSFYNKKHYIEYITRIINESIDYEDYEDYDYGIDIDLARGESNER